MKVTHLTASTINKLKKQFLILGGFLILVMAVFTIHAWQQIRNQELQTYQRIADSAFNQMQARISEFLSLEDTKSFSDYQFDSNQLTLTEEQAQKGFLGYFQIDANNKFASQFSNLITVDTSPASKPSKTKKQHQKLESLTQNLINEEVGQKDQGYVQLNTNPSVESEAAPKKTNLEKLGGLDKEQKIAKRKKSIYPNPFSRGESKTGSILSSDDSMAEGTLEMADTDLNTISNQGASAPQAISLPAHEVFANAGPFQARLIGNDYILFYRKVFLENKILTQGFAVDLHIFLSWLVDESFSDTVLQNFISGKISANQKLLYAFAKPLHSTVGKTLFQKSLGYPLSLLNVELTYTQIPFSKAGQYLLVLSIITSSILMAALYFIYASVFSQIQLAIKKEDFVASVTHELKTPLTSIRLSSELLNQGWLDSPQKISEHHRMIQKESERLSRLIDNVLSLSRLEKKAYALNVTEHNPSQEAFEFAKEFQSLVLGEGFEWHQQISQDLPNIRYDSDALKQILFNLIENSLKFSKSSLVKKISMNVFLQDNQVVWQIRDFGPGVPETEIDKIFDKFYRIENELTRSTKGTGIGLSLVKSLCQQMHTQIQAKNMPDGGLSISLIFSII